MRRATLQFAVQAWSLWAIPIATSLHRVEKPRKVQCSSFFPCICAVSEAIADTGMLLGGPVQRIGRLWVRSRPQSVIESTRQRAKSLLACLRRATAAKAATQGKRTKRRSG